MSKANGTSKTAVYLRVSTNQQENGIQSQEQAIQQYLDNYGIVDAVWYRDRLSGKSTERPDFVTVHAFCGSSEGPG
ncbi:MAG: recombinase family protein [Planctomycetota bacterium]